MATAQLATSLMIEVEDRGRDNGETNKQREISVIAVRIWPIGRFKIEHYGY